jgi:hypothetical protein
MKQPPAKSRLGRRIAALYLSLLVVGPLVEIGARAYDAVRWGTPWSASPDYTADLVVHDSAGIHGRPQGRYQKWQLNTVGFRSPESVLTAPDSCTRVLVIGASESFGYAEPAGLEYPAQLADSLRGSGCFSVGNAAVAGLSVGAIDHMFRRWVLPRFRPDIVVLIASPALYLGDDDPKPLEPKAGGGDPPPRRLRPRSVALAKDLLEFPAFIQERRIERMVEGRSAGKDSTWFFATIPPTRLARFRDDLDSLTARVQASGARMVLLTRPVKFLSETDSGARSGLQALRQFGARALPRTILAFDSAGALEVKAVAARYQASLVDARRTMSGRPELFADPVHYSIEGAAVLAGLVAQEIRTLTTRRTPPAMRPMSSAASTPERP